MAPPLCKSAKIINLISSDEESDGGPQPTSTPRVKAQLRPKGLLHNTEIRAPQYREEKDDLVMTDVGGDWDVDMSMEQVNRLIEYSERRQREKNVETEVEDEMLLDGESIPVEAPALNTNGEDGNHNHEDAIPQLAMPPPSTTLANGYKDDEFQDIDEVLNAFLLALPSIPKPRPNPEDSSLKHNPNFEVQTPTKMKRCKKTDLDSDYTPTSKSEPETTPKFLKVTPPTNSKVMSSNLSSVKSLTYSKVASSKVTVSQLLKATSWIFKENPSQKSKVTVKLEVNSGSHSHFHKPSDWIQDEDREWEDADFTHVDQRHHGSCPDCGIITSTSKAPTFYLKNAFPTGRLKKKPEVIDLTSSVDEKPLAKTSKYFPNTSTKRAPPSKLISRKIQDSKIWIDKMQNGGEKKRHPEPTDDEHDVPATKKPKLAVSGKLKVGFCTQPVETKKVISNLSAGLEGDGCPKSIPSKQLPESAAPSLNLKKTKATFPQPLNDEMQIVVGKRSLFVCPALIEWYSPKLYKACLLRSEKAVEQMLLKGVDTRVFGDFIRWMNADERIPNCNEIALMHLWALAKTIEVPKLQNDCLDALEAQRVTEWNVQEKHLKWVFGATVKGDMLRRYLVDVCLVVGMEITEPCELAIEMIEARKENEPMGCLEIEKYHVVVVDYEDDEIFAGWDSWSRGLKPGLEMRVEHS